MVGSGSAFDAVLMDLQMPEMDGIQATQRIREDARFQGLPIIAMTAHAMVEERERCLAVGMVDHISKPVDPPTLFKTIARWVRVLPAQAVDGLLASVAASPVGTASDLPEVPGLDGAGGLARVGGNLPLYLRLLRQFADKQADAGARTAAALATNDHATAERIAHTVRGVAGNIGFTALHQAATQLEKAIGSGHGIEPSLQAFNAELDRAMHALRSALQATPQAVLNGTLAEPVDLSLSADCSVELARMLAASDGLAGDYLAAHRAELQHALGHAALAEVEGAMDEFEYEIALEHLRGAAAARGISW
jgi:two-component system sensor histidine kinase/response regulator